MAATLHSKVGKSQVSQRSTTGPQDIAALTTAIVETIRQAEYDDMTWPEIDQALMGASHEVKITIGSHGTLDPPDLPAGFSAVRPPEDSDPDRHRGNRKNDEPEHRPRA